ncbi:VIT and vWA domain-containing protein [Paraferrimonas haliotis]|uniref:VIT and vWA domain-containing protein n=1 Tax=Paraferrimonas haliotis TaxID=2013866 RepID=UPI000BA98F0E|nr:VIT domain-containing protein [Paraferrimonas haliotis]
MSYSQEHQRARHQNNPLKQARLSVEVQGILAISTLRQTFHNDSDTVIESLYQFPLPSDAALLDLEVTINGQVFQGEVQPRKQAQRAYETGVAEAKRSVMLEQLDDGLYGLSLGNLAENDTVEIAITIASLISHGDGMWHYFMPTVIGPRYGYSRVSAEHTPFNSIFAEYPLAVEVTVEQELTGEIRSNLQSDKSGLSYGGKQQSFSGYLDEQLHLSWSSSLTPSYAYQARDQYGNSNLIGLIQPPKPRQLRWFERSVKQSANVQLVVDCSGSMSGLSIQQARQGLQQALSQFGESDLVNLIRFGSHHVTTLKGPGPFSGRNKQQLLAEIETLNADLGGTNLWEALDTAIEGFGGKSGDILLLTDGQVWGSDYSNKLLRKAQQQGIRIFTVGVGSSVSNEILELLSKGTQANMLLLDQHNSMARQLSTLIEQLNSAKITCSSNLEGGYLQQPKAVFSGVSQPMYYAAPTLPEAVKLDFNCGDSLVEAQQLAIEPVSGVWQKALNQLVSQQQLASFSDEGQAEKFALMHQLMSRHTAFVFVDKASVEGADGIPTMVNVPQMQPKASMMINAKACYKEAPIMELTSRVIEADYAMESFEDRHEVDMFTPKKRIPSEPQSFDDIAIALLEEANIRLDRRHQTPKPFSLIALTDAGFESFVARNLQPLADEKDEHAAVCWWLLSLNKLYSVLSVRVEAYCKAQAKGLHPEDDLKVMAKVLSKHRAF